MEENIFRREMARVEGLNGIDPGLTHYFTGYKRGLRRAFHGEKFGTQEEHEKWLSLVDDDSRRRMGLGYRHGLKGKLFGGRDYCKQGVGDCINCVLSSYGNDCKNNSIKQKHESEYI